MYQCLEKFIQGKQENQDLCEDAIFTGKKIIAVIDGATSLSGKTFNGKKGGRIASELILIALEELDSDSDLKFDKIEENINHHFKEFYKNHKVFDYKENPLNRIAASAVIVNLEAQEFYMVGDCHALIANTMTYFENNKTVDDINKEIRNAYVRNQIENNVINEEDFLVNDELEKSVIKENILSQYWLQNRGDLKYGYSVFDGMPIPRNKIKTCKIGHGTQLIIATDGYFKLFKTLQESENFMKDLIKSDPISYKYNYIGRSLEKGFLSFDDRAYVSIEIN